MFKFLLRNKISLVLFAILVLFLIFFLSSKKQTDNYYEFTVEKGDLSNTFLLAGNIDANKRVELGFAASGRVKEVYKETGSQVKKNDVIARLSQDRIRANLERARAQYQLTESNTSADLASVKNNLEKQIAEQDSLVKARYQNYISGDLQAYLVDDDDPKIISPRVSGVYSELKTGEYILDIYSSGTSSGYSYRLSGLSNGVGSVEVNQPGKLGEQGLYLQFSPGVSYKNTRWVIPVPNNRSLSYLERKNAYETALATRDRVVSGLQRELERVVGDGRNISSLRAQKNAAKAEITAVYSEIHDGTIRAPFDGVIAKNNLTAGEIVSGFSSAVTLVDTLNKELKLNVPEIYINRISIGDKVKITLDAYPGESFFGTIHHFDIIDTLVDGVPVYETTVSLDDQDPKILLGMNAKAEIVTEEKKDVLYIMKHALQKKGENFTVLVDSQGDMIEKNIITGMTSTDGKIEVISGLQKGDIVFIPKDKKS